MNDSSNSKKKSIHQKSNIPVLQFDKCSDNSDNCNSDNSSVFALENSIGQSYNSGHQSQDYSFKSSQLKIKDKFAKLQENDSNLSKKLMAKESDLLNFFGQNGSRKLDKPRQVKEEEKVYKDSQFNHSKIIRQIEQMLNDLMIDFNNGLIIQMTLQQKLDLKQKLQVALKNREKLRDDTGNNIDVIGPISKHLSDNDLTNNQNNIKNHQKIIQEMRQNRYMNKASEKQKQQFVQKMSGGIKINKMLAFEADYDFYFQNNQGMFVIQSQLKYVDLNKLKKKKDIGQILSSVEDFEDT